MCWLSSKRLELLFAHYNSFYHHQLVDPMSVNRSTSQCVVALVERRLFLDHTWWVASRLMIHTSTALFRSNICPLVYICAIHHVQSMFDLLLTTTAHVRALLHQLFWYVTTDAHNIRCICRMRRCPVNFLCLPTHKRTRKCVHSLNRSISLPIPQCSVNYTILKAMSGTPSAMMKIDIDAIHQFLCAQG